MAKPVFDVAALAREYGQRPIQCRACKMRPDVLEVARQLYRVHALPFNAISRAMSDKFGEKISGESLRKHFGNHEAKAA